MRICIVAIVLAAALLAVGCSGGMPVRWQPSEQQKQAADLAVKDLAALTPHVAAPGQPLRQEAARAAEITQTYVGLPSERLRPGATLNQQVLDQADDDAARAPPTAGQVAESVLARAEQIAQAGFGWAKMLLTSAGSIAATWGAVKVAQRIGGVRERADAAETALGESLQALREVAAGIDELPAETKGQVKAAQANHQSRETELLVAEARKGQ